MPKYNKLYYRHTNVVDDKIHVDDKIQKAMLR